MKHFFIDLDQTLTSSRSVMLRGHRDVFKALCQERDVIVVSGATVRQIRRQVACGDGFAILAQAGNDAYDKLGTPLWTERLTNMQVKEALRLIHRLKAHFDYPVLDHNDLTEFRGAQVAYSVVGFNANKKEKYAFDPGGSKRVNALEVLSKDVKRLIGCGGEVTSAGTTSFNFNSIGKNKGSNISRFIERLKWDPNECVYFGDALYKGGNDESVIGVIKTIQVYSPEDTFRHLQDWETL